MMIRAPQVPRSARTPIAMAAVLVLAIAVAIPVLAASPAPSGAPGNGRGADRSHEPEVPVTLTGVVTATTGAGGEHAYTLTAGGRTITLEAGPPWFWGDKNPLAAAVGKSVTIVGQLSGNELEVQSLDGTVIRQPGKPPWAGGPKALGSIHPGWSQAKADKWAAHQAAKAQRADEHAACGVAPPCHDEPEESEAPQPSAS